MSDEEKKRPEAGGGGPEEKPTAPEERPEAGGGRREEKPTAPEERPEAGGGGPEEKPTAPTPKTAAGLPMQPPPLRPPEPTGKTELGVPVQPPQPAEPDGKPAKSPAPSRSRIVQEDGKPTEPAEPEEKPTEPAEPPEPTDPPEPPDGPKKPPKPPKRRFKRTPFGRFVYKGAHLLKRFLIWLAILPFRIASLFYSLSYRVALVLATLIVLGYFLLTTFFTGPDILNILNAVLRGGFQAEYVYFAPLEQRVDLYDVAVKHPNGKTMVKAHRIYTKVDLMGLAFWGFKKAIGVSAQMPIHFTRIEVKDFYVLLPFDGPAGFDFHEAFMPISMEHEEEEPEEEEGSGPPPLISLTKIELTNGRVDLVFPDWRMDVASEFFEATIRIDGSDFRLMSKEGRISGFRLTGELFPENLRWIGNQVSRAHVGMLKMDLAKIEIGGVVMEHPDFTAKANLAFDFSKDDLPAFGEAIVRLFSPARLDEVTGGQVFGTAEARVKIGGSLISPEISGTVNTPGMMVQNLLLENIAGKFSFAMNEEVRVELPEVSAELGGAPVNIVNGAVTLGLGEEFELDIGFDACFEGLYPAPVAGAFEVDALNDMMDLQVSGCCSNCTFAPTATGIDLSAELSLTVDPGEMIRDLSGVESALVETRLKLTESWVRWDDLELASNLGDLTTQGRLDFADELTAELTLKTHVNGLGQVSMLKELGIDGMVELHDFTFAGSPEAPVLSGSLYGVNLSLMGQHFQALELDLGYDKGAVKATRLCFKTGVNTGCIDADTDLSSILEGEQLALPLELTIDEAVEVDLAALPFVNLPFTGEVTVGPAHIKTVITEDVDLILGALEADVMVIASELSLPGVTLGEMAAHIRKKQTLDAPSPYGGIDALLSLGKADFSGLKLQTADVQLKLESFQMPPAEALLPLLAGQGVVKISGLSFGPYKLRTASLSLDTGDAPGALAFKGKANLTRAVGVAFEGKIDADEVGEARIRLNRFPIAKVPPLSQDEELKALLASTKVTGDIRASNMHLAAIAAGETRSFLNKLRADAKIRVTGLENMPEPISTVDANVRLQRGKVHARSLEVKLANGTLLEAAGVFNPWTSYIDAQLGLSRTRISTLKTVAALELPLDTIITGEVSLKGRLTRPELSAQLGIEGLVATGIELGNATVNVDGKVGEQLVFASETFFKGFSLAGGTMDFRHSLPSVVVLDMGFEKFTIDRLFAGLPELLQAHASGTAKVTLDMVGGEPFTLDITIPDKRIRACINTEFWSNCFANETLSTVQVTSKGVALAGFKLVVPGYFVSANGMIGFTDGWDLRAAFNVDLSVLDLLADSLASYSGEIGTGGGGVHLTGPMEAPRLDGRIDLKNIRLLPRGLGAEIEIPGSHILMSGGLTDGNLLVYIEEDAPLAGQMDEGRFAVHGWAKLVDFMPHSMLLNLNGKDIYYNVPGQYEILLSPKLELSLKDLSDPEEAAGRLSGDLFVAEGEYSKNFDLLVGSFASAFGRSQERYSKPITETLPFLKKILLDMRILGGNFDVASKFPFGETDLTVNLDLRVEGSIDNLKLHDRMMVVPGGTITYKVVKRIFEVVKGTVDFHGEPGKPYLDVEASTRVRYKPPDSSGNTTFRQQDRDEVDVRIQLSGEYPNLTPSFSSPTHPELDTADLQMLLLLGMTRRDLESGGTGADISINVLTDDVAGLVSKMVLAPFVDAVSLGFTQEGRIRAEAATKIGRAMELTTQVKQTADGSEYSAGFEFRITDRLSLEGTMETSTNDDPNKAYNTYQGRFRYIIPLE